MVGNDTYWLGAQNATTFPYVKYYVFRTSVDRSDTFCAGTIEAVRSVVKRILMLTRAQLDCWLYMIRATMGSHVEVD